MDTNQQYESVSKENENERQLLTFFVDGEEYGVDILRVQEIRGWTKPMPVPNVPSFIKGVINIRGEIVPVADLRERLGLPSLQYGPTTVVVVLRVQSADRERIMGIIVDAMSDVTNVPEASIKVPETFDSDTTRLVQGIATLEEKMLMILSTDEIFRTTQNQTAAA